MKAHLNVIIKFTFDFMHKSTLIHCCRDQCNKTRKPDRTEKIILKHLRGKEFNWNLSRCSSPKLQLWCTIWNWIVIIYLDKFQSTKLSVLVFYVSPCSCFFHDCCCQCHSVRPAAIHFMRREKTIVQKVHRNGFQSSGSISGMN